MRNTTVMIALGALVLLSTGCANGPVRRWICGGNCNTPPAVTYPGAFATPNCPTCNTGVGNPAVTGAPIVGNQPAAGGIPAPGGFNASGQ